MPDLVQAQRVEAQRVLRVELAPAARRGARSASGARSRSARVKPPSTSRCAARSGSAAQMSAALRMARRTRLVATGWSRTNSAVARKHAAEVLRPGLVRGRVEDHVADLAGAQLLRLGRKAEEGVDLAFGEQLHGVSRRASATHSMSSVGIEPDVCRHDRHVTGVRPRPATSMPTFLPFRSLMVRMGSCANSSKHPVCTPASAVIGTPASRRKTSDAGKKMLKSSSPRASTRFPEHLPPRARSGCR